MSETRLRAESRVLGFALLGAFLSSPGQTFFIAAFTASMAASIGVSVGELGIIYMAATLAAGLSLPLFGAWIDRLDLKLYTPLVVAGLALACLVTALSAGPFSLLAGLLLLRLCGQGLMSHIAVTSTARYFTQRRGRALALVALGFPLAEAVSPSAGVALIAALGWRGAYLAIAVGLLLAALPLLLALIAGRPDFTRPEGETTPGVRPGRIVDAAGILFRSRYFWMILPAALFLPFSATGVIFHIQPLALAKGWAPELIGPGFLLFALGHVAGLTISGRLIDRYNARLILPGMNLPFFAGLAGLAAFGHPVMLIVFLFLLGTSSGFAQTSVAAMWAEVYGTARMGAIRSLAVMLMVVGTAAGPAVVGGAIDAGTPVAAIAVALIVAGVLASLLAFAALASGAREAARA